MSGHECFHCGRTYHAPEGLLAHEPKCDGWRGDDAQRIVAMIRDRSGAYYSRDTLKVADAIERGEHRD